MENPPIVPPAPPVPEPVVPVMPEAASAPPPAGSAPAPRPFGFGALLRRAFSIWRIQWLRSLLLMLRGMFVGALFLVPPLVIYGVMSYVMSGYLVASMEPAAGSIGLSAGPPAWMRVARAAASVLGILGVLAAMFVQIKYGLAQLHLIAGADERIGVRDALSRTKGRFWPFLVFGFLSSLVAFGAMLLLAIPWFIWMPTFILAPWIFAVEGRKGLDVLVQSRRWVKGDGLSVFIHLFALSILIAIGNAILGSIGRSGGAGVAIAMGGLTALIQIVFLMPFQSAFSYAIYEALKAKKGPTPPELPQQRKYFIAATVAGILVIPVLMLGLGLALKGYAKKRSEAAAFRLTTPALLQDSGAEESEPASVTTSPQGAEETQGSEADDPEGDPDGDGMLNGFETRFETHPGDPDTDGDGLGDHDEQYVLLTSPTRADTDGDGHADAAEILAGYDPLTAGAPMSDAQRFEIIRYHELGQYHEPTLTTLRPFFP